jgi:hypothetical protein
MQKTLRSLLLLVVVGFVVFTTGAYAIVYLAVWKSEQRFRNDAEQLAQFLNADPAYRELIAVNFPSLGYSLSGPVETQANLDRLRQEVVRVFGEERAPHIMADVWIEPRSKAKAKPNEQPK